MQKSNNRYLTRELIKYLVILYFYFGIAFPHLNAQDRPADPISPTAASLGKYGNVPVSLYTGQVNPNVPLYEVKLPDFSLPISLSYNYSGLKLEDYPDRVGLGWILNAGGVINRQVRGIPDEDPNGYRGSMGPRLESYFADQLDSAEMEELFQDIVKNGKDGEMDLFSYNFGGNSGQFFMPNDEVGAITIPYSPMKITASFNISANNAKGEIQNFWAKDPNGNVYTFTNSDSPYEISGDDDISGSILSLYASSWYLKEITTMQGNKITFNYDVRLMALPKTISESVLIAINPPTFPVVPVLEPLERVEIRKTISQYVLTEIVVKNPYGQPLKTIAFYEGEDRLDWTVPGNVENETVPKTLNWIVITDHTRGQGIVKAFKMEYSYFGNNKRLKLDRVIEAPMEFFGPGEAPVETNSYPYSFNMTNAITRYEFDYYYGSTMPGIGSNMNIYAQDHWGYYNAKNNTSLVPKTTIFSTGADRNPSFTTLGMIKTIKYSTGGSTTFEYESHGFDKGQLAMGSNNFIDLCDQQLFEWQTGEYINADTSISFTLTERSCIALDYKLTRECGSAVWVKLGGGPLDLYGNIQLYHVDELPTDFNGSNDIKTGSYAGTLEPGNYSIQIWSLDDAGVSGCADPSVEFTLMGGYGDNMADQIIICDSGNTCIEQQSVCNSGDSPAISEFDIPDHFAINAQLYYELISQCNEKAAVKIYKESGGVWSLLQNIELQTNELTDEINTIPFLLVAGKYKIEAQVEGDFSGCNESFAKITLNYPDVFDDRAISEVKVGGVRVAQVTDCNEDGECITTSYEYTQAEDSRKSSGLLLIFPSYEADKRIIFSDASNSIISSYPAVTISSTSNIILTASRGSHIAYTTVKIRKEGSENVGKTVNNYSFIYDTGNTNFPFPPPENKDWERGHLDDQKVYLATSKCGTSDRLVKEIDTQKIAQDISKEKYNAGIRFGRYIYYRGDLGGAPIVYGNYKWANYDIITGWNPLGSETETSYSYSGSEVDILTNYKEYSYNNQSHMQVTDILSIKSNMDTLATHFRYPLDGYESGAPSQGITSLNSLGVLTPVIEQIRSIKNKNKVIAKSLTNYTVGNLSIPRVSGIAEAPNGTEYETSLAINAYDDAGNILEILDRNGTTSSYLWSYDHSLLVAKIINVGYDEVGLALGSDLAILNGAVAPSDADIRDIMSALRDNMPNGLVTSFTHQPDIGITSQTDPNGQSIYYEYDTFGRLKLIKDNEQNIIQATEYNYYNEN